MEATLSLVIIRWVLLYGCRRGQHSPYGGNGHTRFSGTARMRRASGCFARAHRRQLDAMGRDDRPVSRAIARRRLADDLAERAAERPEAGEADVEADVGDVSVRLAQEEH